MFNNEQFRTIIVKPVLNGLNLWTPVAEELLIATMANESLGGTFLVEEGGNALGIYQMEPEVHDKLWAVFLPNHSEVAHRLMQTCGMSTQPLKNMMVYNLFYATAMARIYYLNVPQAIPEDTNIDSLWLYYKQWWNTNQGSATKDEFISNYGKFTTKGNKREKGYEKGKG